MRLKYDPASEPLHISVDPNHQCQNLQIDRAIDGDPRRAKPVSKKPPGPNLKGVSTTALKTAVQPLPETLNARHETRSPETRTLKPET